MLAASALRRSDCPQRAELFAMSCTLLKCEVKRRAAIDFALSPDPAAVPVDDPLHVRESDTGALELARRVQALENGEQFPRVFHIEARSIVAEVADQVAIS